MKLLEILKLSTKYLEKKGIESARLNSELMLCKILKSDRVNLYVNYEKPLSLIEIETMREYLKRRVLREPLQYILEEQKFYGLYLKLNKKILIPRPETELLVDEVINIYKNQKIKIFEIGTGSGNIAISLGKSLDQSSVISIDINPEAITLAKLNSDINNVKNVDFKELDLFKLTDEFGIFDVIVSNPPYILESEKINLQKEISDYEPPEALFVKDEMLFFKKIIELGIKILNPCGKIFFECGYGQADKIKKIFIEYGFRNVIFIKDFQNIDRIIIGEKN